MNTTAANQADRQIELVSEDPLGKTQARWSTDDELLVWTVSRIEGGRRHGVERDCHVVYALSRGFFVEQTRKFRASAEQCIDMLQQGKRAGTIQRKIALDSIIALKSDARSGRLQIRTLNGTHQIEPVSNEEADVLRQIGGELALRMPAGGASFADYSGPSHTERRRAQEAAAEVADRAERERHALVAVENARAEDAPDAYVAPSYDGADEALFPVVDEAAPAAAMSAEELQRIAAAVHAEMGPASEPVAELPTDITVAGGVDIRFSPAPDYAPSVEVPAEYLDATYVAPEYPAAEHFAAEHVAAEHVSEEYVADQAAEAEFIAAESAPAEYAEAEYVAPVLAPEAYAAAEYVAPEAPPAEYPAAEFNVPQELVAQPAAEYVSAEPSAEQPTEYGELGLFEDLDATESPGGQDAAETAENFDRRQQRALRRQLDGDAAATDYTAMSDLESAASPPLFPADPDLDLPAGAVFEPVAETPVHHEPIAGPADEQPHLHLTTPAARAPFSPEPYVSEIDHTDGGHVDDPSIPSVFDRRGAHPVVPVERPGWARFEDDEDESADALDSAEQAEDQATELADGPPTLVAPTGGQPIGSGGAVGFNPDFDVNPFR